MQTQLKPLASLCPGQAIIRPKHNRDGESRLWCPSHRDALCGGSTAAVLEHLKRQISAAHTAATGLLATPLLANRARRPALPAVRNAGGRTRSTGDCVII